MNWEFFPASEIVPRDTAGRPKAAKYVGRTTRMASSSTRTTRSTSTTIRDRDFVSRDCRGGVDHRDWARALLANPVQRRVVVCGSQSSARGFRKGLARCLTSRSSRRQADGLDSFAWICLALAACCAEVEDEGVAERQDVRPA